jgi:hypothetical protein
MRVGMQELLEAKQFFFVAHFEFGGVDEGIALDSLTQYNIYIARYITIQ